MDEILATTEAEAVPYISGLVLRLSKVHPRCYSQVCQTCTDINRIEEVVDDYCRNARADTVSSRAVHRITIIVDRTESALKRIPEMRNPFVPSCLPNANALDVTGYFDVPRYQLIQYMWRLKQVAESLRAVRRLTSDEFD